MQLGSRASKKYSDPNAWHNQFYSLVTTKIDEEIFKPLFPEGKKSGRPNASIRILVAMSVLKEGPAAFCIEGTGAVTLKSVNIICAFSISTSFTP